MENLSASSDGEVKHNADKRIESLHHSDVRELAPFVNNDIQSNMFSNPAVSWFKRTMEKSMNFFLENRAY